MRYRVRSLAADGSIVAALHEARDAGELRARLSADGLAVLSVRPCRADWRRLRRAGGGRDAHLVFCDQLQTLLAAGISVPESLLALRDSESEADFRGVIGQLLAAVAGGQPLSAALAAQPADFPPILPALLKAAERTASLAEALARYTRYQRQLGEFRDRLWAAATYPLLLLAAGGAVVLFLLLYVVPRFTVVYRDVIGPLPWAARLLLAWGEFADGRAGLILGGLALLGLAALLAWQRATWRARLAGWAARLPGVGELLREIQLAHYFHSLGLLLAAGLPLTPALELSRDILAAGLRPAAAAVAGAVRAGSRLSAALAGNGLATPVALRLIQAGERSGRLAELLGQAAAFHDRRILHASEVLARLAGPLLMAAMGLLIGGIVVLLYLPIFQLAEGLN